MGIDSYTYEDYLSDFELDYLGFDGIPKEPVPDPSPEKTAGKEPGQEAGGFGENGQPPGFSGGNLTEPSA